MYRHILMAFLTPLAFSLLLLPLLCLLLLIRERKKADTKETNLPPGPTNLPFIGNLHKLGHLPHRSLLTLSQEHGPLMFLKLGSVPTIVASTADTAKELLTTHDLQTCSRPRLTSLHRLSYGSNDISFAPYGERWRELRKVSIVELFSTKKVLSFRPIREDEVDRMINKISAQSYDVNLSEELVSLGNHVICRTALGKRYYNEGEGGSLKRILRETEAMFVGFFFADYIPMLGWLDRLTGMRDRLERNFHELDGFFQQVVDDHMDPQRREGDRVEDAIDTLLNIQKNGTHLTDEHIKGVLMDIFVAGSETSSTIVEWVFAELMRNPSAMKKAQDEVRSIIGSKKTVREIDLDQLHYLKCIVKEVMRLHPAVPLLLQRETIQHCRINNIYDIPPRTRLLINLFAIGRDANLWKNPDKFYPERFIDNSIDFKGHDFGLIPFGAGRRICPGMNVGILVVELALANLLYSFNWKLPADISKEDIDMAEVPGIAVHRKYDLHLVAKRYK